MAASAFRGKYSIRANVCILLSSRPLEVTEGRFEGQPFDGRMNCGWVEVIAREVAAGQCRFGEVPDVGFQEEWQSTGGWVGAIFRAHAGAFLLGAGSNARALRGKGPFGWRVSSFYPSAKNGPNSCAGATERASAAPRVHFVRWVPRGRGDAGMRQLLGAGGRCDSRDTLCLLGVTGRVCDCY